LSFRGQLHEKQRFPISAVLQHIFARLKSYLQKVKGLDKNQLYTGKKSDTSELHENNHNEVLEVRTTYDESVVPMRCKCVPTYLHTMVPIVDRTQKKHINVQG
jgi:hypothetical protein